jgi:hypothetical protein
MVNAARDDDVRGGRSDAAASQVDAVDVAVVTVGDDDGPGAPIERLSRVRRLTKSVGRVDHYSGGPRFRWSEIRARAVTVITYWAILDIVAIAIIWGLIWAVVGPSIADGRLIVENDTRVFYYPIFAALGDAWRTGRLPLWSPDLLTGYPLFADGEAGVLYPVHLLSLLLLPVDDAFAWQRPIRLLQGGTFTYAFVRSVGVGRAGSIVGGLAFGLGGFAVAQAHHVNIATGATWLPLALCFGELAVRRSGRARWGYALVGAVPFGLQGLIVHVQVLILSALTFVTYVTYRVIVGPVGDGTSSQKRFSPGLEQIMKRWERLALRIALLPVRGVREVIVRAAICCGIVAIVGGIGASLAAVQLVPLFELGTYSFRGSGVDYSFATEYQLPVSHFLSFLLPDAFMTATWPEEVRRYWGLWSRWEVFGYVGLETLCLAPFGLVFGRSRVRWYFGALTVVALALSVGEYSPFDAHRAMSQLPGFSALRAPGRFVFLSTLGFAVLAGLGVDALTREWKFDREREMDRGWAATSRRIGFTAILGTAQAVAVGGPTALAFFETYATNHKEEVMVFLQRQFVVMRGFDTRLNLEQLYQFALASLDLAQPEVARQVGLLVAVVLVLTMWDRLRAGGIVWQAALVALLALDLGAIARTFHPTQSISQLRDPGAVGRFLATQPGMSAANGAIFRVFTQKGTRDEPNRLLLAGVSQANGYSSLEPDRHTRYVAAAWFAPNRLLDLMGVRFFVTPASFRPLPSFNLTSFDNDRPLFSSTSSNGGAKQVVNLSATSGDSIRVISTMRWGTGVAQGQPVARLTVVSAAGARRELTMQAGIHTAEWDWERPELAGKVSHQMPPEAQIARTWRELDVRSRPPGQTFAAHMYYAEFPLGAVTPLDRIEVTFLHPTAQLEIFGIAVFNDTTKDLEQADISRNARFKKVFADTDAVLYENPTALPRAFLVPTVVTMDAAEESLQRMARGDWSPERMAILEVEPVDVDAGFGSAAASLAKRLGPPAPPSEPVVPITYDQSTRRSVAKPGTVTLTTLAPETVILDVDAKETAFLVLTDLYYPGWQATVDGAPTTVFRADYLFRGVEVPAGKHRVEFAYRSRSFRLGLAITIVGATALIVGLVLVGVAAVVGFRARRRRSPKDESGRVSEYAPSGSGLDSLQDESGTTDRVGA